eukprot:COSAG05_NODE_13867_length_415_cov_2.449367_1_plen_79_part_00
MGAGNARGAEEDYSGAMEGGFNELRPQSEHGVGATPSGLLLGYGLESTDERRLLTQLYFFYFWRNFFVGTIDSTLGTV